MKSLRRARYLQRLTKLEIITILDDEKFEYQKGEQLKVKQKTLKFKTWLFIQGLKLSYSCFSTIFKLLEQILA